MPAVAKEPKTEKKVEKKATTKSEVATKAKKKTEKKIEKKVGNEIEKNVEKKERVAGPRSMGSDPVAIRQTNLLRALKKLKATDPLTAKHASTLAEATGYTAYDVYCLCYHKNKLAVEGLVANAKVDGIRGVCHYITTAGLESITK